MPLIVAWPWIEQYHVSIPGCVGVNETLRLLPPLMLPLSTTPSIVNVCVKPALFRTVRFAVWPACALKAFGE